MFMYSAFVPELFVRIASDELVLCDFRAHKLNPASACVNAMHSAMESYSDWSGSTGGNLEFEDMGSQFSAFFSASNGSLSELSSSSLSSSILTSPGVKTSLQNMIPTRTGQVSTSTQSWLRQTDFNPEHDFNTHKSKRKFLFTEGRPLDVKDQCESCFVLKQLNTRGSKTEILLQNLSRPSRLRLHQPNGKVMD